MLAITIIFVVNTYKKFRKRMKVTHLHFTILLGIYISERLTWKDHISYVGRKFSKIIANFICIISVINTEIIRNI